MIKVTSRHMECALLTPDFSQVPAVALHAKPKESRKDVYGLVLTKAMPGSLLSFMLLYVLTKLLKITRSLSKKSHNPRKIHKT